jgi:hypothetical protein
MAGIQWTTDEERILTSNPNSRLDDLHKLLPTRSKASIGARLKYLGIKRIKNPRKYSINMNFFSEPNVINSYFAGFIAADGCITPRKHLVSFGLKASDGCILEELVRACGYEGSVGYNGSDYKRADLFLWGVKQWHEDLEKHYNIIPKKSLVLIPPKLTDVNNIKSFMKGYIDGDGGIYPQVCKNKWILRIRGTKEMMDWFADLFDKWVPENSKKLSKPYLDKIWTYRVSGKRSLKILSSLLEVDTPRLKRKWQPVIDHLNNHPIM